MFPPLPTLGGFSGGVSAFGGSGLNYESIDRSIQTFEGWFPGSVSYRNNNPGNIQYGTFAINHGANGSANGFATFPTESIGFAATDALVTQYANKGATLRDLFNAWSPPNAPGNSKLATDNYVSFVSQQTGINPDSPINATNAGSTGVLGSIWQGLTGTGAFSNSSAFNQVNSLFGFSWGRTAAFILGLILIAGGIMLFKPAATFVIQNGRRVIESGGV